MGAQLSLLPSSRQSLRPLLGEIMAEDTVMAMVDMDTQDTTEAKDQQMLRPMLGTDMGMDVHTGMAVTDTADTTEANDLLMPKLQLKLKLSHGTDTDMRDTHTLTVDMDTHSLMVDTTTLEKDLLMLNRTMVMEAMVVMVATDTEATMAMDMDVKVDKKLSTALHKTFFMNLVDPFVKKNQTFYIPDIIITPM